MADGRVASSPADGDKVTCMKFCRTSSASTTVASIHAVGLVVACLSILSASVVHANTISDQGGDDYCGDAVDPSGAAPPAPISSNAFNNYCDANSPDTAVQSTGGSAVLVSVRCVDNPLGHGAVTDTTCVGGGLSIADTAFGAGNLGGDYPIASSVVFTNNGPAARYSFTMDYVDTTSGVLASSALSAPVCMTTGSSYTFAIPTSALAATANQVTPAGQTIDEVYAYRTFVTAGGTACGNADPNTIRNLAFDWTYDAPASPSMTSAAASITVTGGVCTAWSGSASNAGTSYGEAQVSLYDITAGQVYDNTINGWSGSGSSVAASDSTTGVTLKSGHTYILVATIWAIGDVYRVAFSAPGVPVLCP